MKTVATRFQLHPQIGVIVDLAVEDDDGISVVADDGLIATREIDDFEADRTQGHVGILVYALLVRTAMNKRSRDSARYTFIGRPVRVSKTGYTAHETKSPPPALRRVHSPVTAWNVLTIAQSS